MENHIYNILVFIALYTIVLLHVIEGVSGNFSPNYYPLWGKDHITFVGQNDVSLRFDKYSGAGFRSQWTFSSGLFEIRMKISPNRSKGVVASFYLNNAPYGEDGKPHDEVDFEFVGTEGILQTNVFASDNGQREEQFQLWFDPSKDFHTYQILWNNRQIVFFVDKIPIRVYKKMDGVYFPWNPMRIEASTWHADWAGDVDWSKAPFYSSYEGFDINGCSPPNDCASSKFYWNNPPYLELSPKELEQMRWYRKKHLIYSYCTKTANIHPECKINE